MILADSVRETTNSTGLLCEYIPSEGTKNVWRGSCPFNSQCPLQSTTAGMEGHPTQGGHLCHASKSQVINESRPCACCKYGQGLTQGSSQPERFVLGRIFGLEVIQQAHKIPRFAS